MHPSRTFSRSRCADWNGRSGLFPTSCAAYHVSDPLHSVTQLVCSPVQHHLFHSSTVTGAKLHGFPEGFEAGAQLSPFSLCTNRFICSAIKQCSFPGCARGLGGSPVFAKGLVGGRQGKANNKVIVPHANEAVYYRQGLYRALMKVAGLWCAGF